MHVSLPGDRSRKRRSDSLVDELEAGDCNAHGHGIPADVFPVVGVTILIEDAAVRVRLV